MLEPKFPVGEIKIDDETAYALTISGQDIGFFLHKHTTGDYGECTAKDADANEQAIRDKESIMSWYRTLRGHEIVVVTNLAKGETFLVVRPNSVIKYVPLMDFAHWHKKKEGTP